MYQILMSRYSLVPELEGVQVLPGFNPSGDPVFQRLAEVEPLAVGQYIAVWKAYLVSLVGNWILESYDNQLTADMRELDSVLRKYDLRLADHSPKSVFSHLTQILQRVVSPKSFQVAVTTMPDGRTIYAPKLEFGDSDTGQTTKVAPAPAYDASLEVLNRSLAGVDWTVWVVLDRLDEAFQGFPRVEIPALRGLLRTFLDLQAFPNIKLKLFVRKDLFRKVIQGGFVNLTHINARKIEIVWDDDDLFDLLYRRVQTATGFMSKLGIDHETSEQVFAAVFPPKVDTGSQKPTTRNWMISRIRDGNHVKPPRNLIDLVQKAQQAQLRKEEREPRDYSAGMTIIEASSIKQAHGLLSRERVFDTLLAEAGEYSQYIERFRNGKAEHTLESLARVLQLPSRDAAEIAKVLREIGFLEQIGDAFKIPPLYREGLNVTQGKGY